jgi:hypothetical protein
MWEIKFVYKDQSEVLETTESMHEAQYLYSEYKLAFKNIEGCEVYLIDTNL